MLCGLLLLRKQSDKRVDVQKVHNAASLLAAHLFREVALGWDGLSWVELLVVFLTHRQRPHFASPHALTFMLALGNDSNDSDKHSHKSDSSACRWNQG